MLSIRLRAKHFCSRTRNALRGHLHGLDDGVEQETERGEGENAPDEPVAEKLQDGAA